MFRFYPKLLRDCIVSITAIAALFGILYALFMARYRERMYLMERGLSPAVFSNKKGVLWATLRYGLLCIGIAIGILMGNFTSNVFDIRPQGAFLAMIFLWGGISLIDSFLIERKLNK